MWCDTVDVSSQLPTLDLFSQPTEVYLYRRHILKQHFWYDNLSCWCCTIIMCTYEYMCISVYCINDLCMIMDESKHTLIHTIVVAYNLADCRQMMVRHSHSWWWYWCVGRAGLCSKHMLVVGWYLIIEGITMQRMRRIHLPTLSYWFF